MHIVSWNIAGVKARIFLIVKLLRESNIDILCLQETKTAEDKFPFKQFNDLGYEVLINSQPQFNGVTIIYKKKEIKFVSKKLVEKLSDEARFLEAIFSLKGKEFKLCCLYSPNGNPKGSSKFEKKIYWLQQFKNFTKSQILKRENTILAGDFNIIPAPGDAKNINKWLDDALYSNQARQAYKELINMGYRDVGKLGFDQEQYSFWDFRNFAREKNDGIRIDFFLLSPVMVNYFKKFYYYSFFRDMLKPSDHIPIGIDLNFD